MTCLLLLLLAVAAVPRTGLPQMTPGVEVAGASGGKFDGPLEWIAGVTELAGSRRLEAGVGAGLEEIARHFHVDVSEPDPLVYLLVQLRDGRPGVLQDAGFPLLARVGDVAATAVRASRLAELRALPDIVKAEGSRALQREIDTSMQVVRANLLRSHVGNGVFTGETGAGALVAVVDSGIDIFHEDFRKANGQTRIKVIWDLLDQSFRNTGGVIGSAPPMTTLGGLPLGTVYTEAQINAALIGSGVVNSRSLEGHGHHVAGVAAGNGRATGGGFQSGRFIGMAPESDLIIIQIFGVDELSAGRTFDDMALGALDFIDQQAQALGLPVAVNMSFGSHVGAHDGTSLLERAIDTFSGPGRRGRVVVKSAGNDGSLDIHAGGLYGPPGALNSVIGVQVVRTGTGPIFFDFWFPGEDTFNVTIDGGGSGTNVLNGLLQTDPANGDKQLFFSTNRSGSFTIFIEGQTVANGRFDAWIPSRNARFNSFAERISRLTVPGTAQHILTVGSFNTKNAWVDIDGVARSSPSIVVGDLSSFSSDGPTRDGRVKPELAAPGQRIGSALAGSFAFGVFGESIFSRSDILQDTVHALSQGTSFAAPHVTGLAAVMLSKNPFLEAPQIRDLLTQNTIRDQFTGVAAESTPQAEILPDVRWGFGKLDAKATLDATPAAVPTQFRAFIDVPSAGATVIPNVTAQGWALASQGLSSVEVLVDGVARATATLGIPRPDVCAVFPGLSPDCPAVGFSAQLTGLEFGPHVLGLRITDQFGNQSSSALPLHPIRVDPFPIRALIDAPSENGSVSPNFEIFGWAISDSGIQSVEILIDGNPGAAPLRNQARPDVCAAFPGADPACPNVGFRALMNGVSTGAHVLTVRVTDGNGATRTLTRNFQVALPRISAFLDSPGVTTAGAFVVNGWATSSVGIGSVEIQVDGVLRGLASLNVSRPDVCAALPGADPRCPNVGFTADVGEVGLGAHALTILVRDTQGEIALLNRNINVVTQAVVDAPRPGAAVSTTFPVHGWALSPAGISAVSLLIDGAVAAAATLNVSRPDVCVVFPGADPACPNVGFQATVTTTPGLHSLAMIVTNGNGQQFVLPLPPIGVVASATGEAARP